MTETGEGIAETQEETTDLVGEIYEDMGSYQEGAMTMQLKQWVKLKV